LQALDEKEKIANGIHIQQLSTSALLLHGGLSITHTPVLLSDAERSKPVLVVLVVVPDFNLFFDVRARSAWGCLPGGTW
jgi:hypothetical protein